MKLAWFKLAIRDGDGDVDLGVNPEAVIAVQVCTGALEGVNIRVGVNERYTVQGDLASVAARLEHPGAPR